MLAAVEEVEAASEEEDLGVVEDAARPGGAVPALGSDRDRRRPLERPERVIGERAADAA